jgi:hypothetical protein
MTLNRPIVMPVSGLAGLRCGDSALRGFADRFPWNLNLPRFGSRSICFREIDLLLASVRNRLQSHEQ